MRSSHSSFRILAIVLGCLLTASMAAAQPDRGPGLGGFVSGSFGDGGPAVALGVSAGYRFSPRMTAEIDASYVPRLELGEIPVCPIEMLCALASTATGPGLFRAGSYVLTGRAKSVSLVLVSQLPIRLGAMRPYVAGGGGFANVRRELRDSVVPFSLRRSSTDPMVTLGGGVDVPVGHKLIVGVDVRYERIFADQQFFRPDIDHDLNLTRVGSSIRYRF